MDPVFKFMILAAVFIPLYLLFENIVVRHALKKETEQAMDEIKKSRFKRARVNKKPKRRRSTK